MFPANAIPTAPSCTAPLYCCTAVPQAVRDEILNIMHRNKIKEVKGTWMEEWHQKLHNVSVRAGPWGLPAVLASVTSHSASSVSLALPLAAHLLSIALLALFSACRPLQNTTPDDVPICEAYIAFLRANGDQNAYWSVLAGVGAAALFGSAGQPVHADCK